MNTVLDLCQWCIRRMVATPGGAVCPHCDRGHNRCTPACPVMHKVEVILNRRHSL